LSRATPDDSERPLVSFNFQDPPPRIPLAGMIQASVTQTANTRTAGTVPADDFPLNKEIIAQQLSIFLNGKLAEHVGCFCQVTYDGAARRTLVDNIEIRAAGTYAGEKFSALYGVTLNNSPTMSDIYNTTPVWGWPYTGSSVAPTPAAGVLIGEGLAQSVAGVSAYAMINKTLYLEAGGYRTADSAFGFLRLGVPLEDRSILAGTAPYYRAALQHEWDQGRQSAMVGAFGLDAKVYPDPAQAYGPSDRFRDSGIDAQYQYITDQHRFSAMATFIRERQELTATYGEGDSSNLKNKVNVLNTKISYYYNKWYGISLGYQHITGSVDAGLYDTGSAVYGSANGSPNSEAAIAELNWLFSTSGADAYRRSRLLLQYTAYSRFNGGNLDYDGHGRKASDNNTLLLMAWLMY
jgi:hypothetical protein